MALTITPGYSHASGGLVTPTRLNTAISAMTINGGAKKLLGTTGAGAMGEVAYTDDGLALLQATTLAAQRKLIGGAALARVSTQFDKTDTTLADVTGLTVDVEAGETYSFEATIRATQDFAGNCSAAIGGTATATAFAASSLYSSNTSAQLSLLGANPATKGAAVDFGNAGTTGQALWIRGTITVNAGGTLTIQFAKRTASGTTSSVLVGSYFKVWQHP